jgi:hypothetical protein
MAVTQICDLILALMYDPSVAAFQKTRNLYETAFIPVSSQPRQLNMHFIERLEVTEQLNVKRGFP